MELPVNRQSAFRAGPTPADDAIAAKFPKNPASDPAEHF
jgi:hypothetical protein